MLQLMFQWLMFGTMIAVALLLLGCVAGIMYVVVRGVLAFVIVLPLGIACGIFDLIEKGMARVR